ncbi:MAG: hypothetical protein ACR2IK_19030, partial [Chloroflexota bacterium]
TLNGTTRDLSPVELHDPTTNTANNPDVTPGCCFFTPPKRWQPSEGLAPEETGAIIHAVATECDRLLLTTLWATGARISEVLALRPRHICREALVLPNLKSPSRLVKTAHLAAAHAGLPGELLVWAREHDLHNEDPLFFSRQHAG